MRELKLDLAAAVIGAIVASLAVPTLALAYVDPSVVTYTIQAVAGVAVALGAVLGVAFRRTRRVIYKVLKIDENANKIVDPEVHPLADVLETREDAEPANGEDLEEADEPEAEEPEEAEEASEEGASDEDAPNEEPAEIADTDEPAALDEEPAAEPADEPSGESEAEPAAEPADELPIAACVTREEADERARALYDEAANGRPAKRLKWPMRLLLALAASAFTISTIFIFTPLELVAASSESLTFGFFDVTDVIISVGVGIALVVALVLTLLRGKVFDVVFCVLVGIGLGCFLQALFLNVSLPSADGSAFHLSEHLGITLIDTIVWVALFVGLLLFNAKKTQLARVLLPFLSVLLLVVQIVSMVGIADEERVELANRSDPMVMTTAGLNEVGAEGDVTVFVLDMFDTDYLDLLLETDPSALDEFTGFTLFHNSLGSLIPTRFGIPFLVTNEFPQTDETFQNYMDRRYADNRFLTAVKDAGYEIGIYTDTVDRNAIAYFAENIHPEHNREFDNKQLWKSLERMSLFREAPWILKPFFRFYTGDLNVSSIDEYTSDNATYYENIFENGLTISETADKTFRFIHTAGAHWPYTMDENGNTVPEQSSVVPQAAGVINYVEEYLRELKRLGVYDQSTIIITADHGRWNIGVDFMSKATSPIMLVKPAETPEEAAQPLKVSYVPTGHVDYAATVVAGVGGDTSEFGPTVFEIPDEPRDRYFWYLTHDGHEDYELLEYLVQGDATNFDDWHFTGNYLEIQPGGLAEPANGEPSPLASPQDDE